ncbi:hypothetical protein [Methylibium petroleiphilum]
MHKAKFALICALFAMANQAFATNHLVEVAWSRDGAFAYGASVEPGKFVELCGKLAPGDSIRWDFAASVLVDFNIHYHMGKEVEFPAKQVQVSAGQDTLRVAVREDYCWMWSNKSSSQARIDVRLQRQN